MDMIEMCSDPEIRKDLLNHLAPIERMVQEGTLLKMKKKGGNKPIYVPSDGVIPPDLVMWDEKGAA